MRAAGIAGYSPAVACLSLTRLSRDWWIGESCLYNAKFRIRVLAVSDFRDQCEDTRLDDGPNFFWCDPIFIERLSATRGLTRKRLSCYSRTACVVHVMSYNLCQWIVACIVFMYVWRTTRVCVNIYLYEGFSLLSCRFLKHSMFLLCILSSLSRALFCPQVLPLFPVLLNICLKVFSRTTDACFCTDCIHMCTYIVLVCMLSLVCCRCTVDRSWQRAPNVVATLRDRVSFDCR